MPMRISVLSVASGMLARARSIWRGVRRRREVEAEMDEEFRHHLELRALHLMRDGVPPKEAGRRARIEFGHIESHKEDARSSRGLRLLDGMRFSWLDVKLGLRMLAKFPGLSLVAVIGMAVAIAIGAGAFGAVSSMMDPTLPLPGGERVVALQNSTRNPGNPDRRSIHDFVMWRDELISVRELSAFVTESRNLVLPAGSVDLVPVARMTASGFRVARVAPVLGRPLLDDDERAGAPPVVVIAHEEWQHRFGGDPDIVGTALRLGSTVHRVVGVMPEGFGFPINHRFWIPLRVNAEDYEIGEGPSIYIFGRLADGVTLERAQAELTTIGARMSAAYPETHEHLRARVLPFTHSFMDIDSPAVALALRAIQLAISMLLVVVAVNVAVLVYARTATRAGEIAVRSALGASRRRIVTQLFAEALVLSGTAALIGLLVATVGLGVTEDFMKRAAREQIPFWLDLGISAGLITYVVGLAVLGAVIVGILPALKATGRRVQAALQQLSSRGSQMQLGRTWTVLIVAQVAIAVAVLPYAMYIAGQSVMRATTAPDYAADEFLRAWISLEPDESPPAGMAAAHDSAFTARFVERIAEVLRRIETEPRVAGVTFATHFPGNDSYGRIEIAGGGTAAVRINRVDVDLFPVFDVPIISGRGFVEADAREGANTVIVDRVFAERVLGGHDVLGRRIRRLGWSANEAFGIEAMADGPWLEIVGVVPDFTVQPDFEEAVPRIYNPMALAQSPPLLSLAVRTRGTPPPAFASRVREITAGVDPDLQLHELRHAADVERQTRQGLLYIALGVGAVTASVLLLSAAGIYAMMSFTVARRRREIGIRSALGADTRRILSGIFARASAQLGAGILGGLVASIAVAWATGVGPFGGKGVLLVPVVAGLMMVIGLLATLGPARRSLSVQPTEALRDE